jgi:perosamine synthetase
VRNIPFGSPIIGDEEKKAVLDVMEGPILVHGPRARDFETRFAAFTGAPRAVSTSSCTSAMHLIYFHLGLQPGDEVIVPAETHTATAHAVELCGAKPVFVDAEIKTGNIDIDQIESAITSRTRAIALVHFLGLPVDMDRLNRVAKKHDVFVLEDCALAVGTYYQGIHAGMLGDAGCFSFYPVKHMTTAEGGMLVTRHNDLASNVALKRAFGVDRNPQERTIPGVYDVTMLGFNYRMNEIQAAIGLEQLRKVGYFLRKRKENYQLLAEGLAPLDEIELLQSSHDGYQSSYFCMSVMLRDSLAPKRLELVSALNRKGVGTSIYYPRPVPHFTYYRQKYGYNEKSFPVAAKISYSSVALPVGPHLNGEDMDYIVKSVKEAVAEVR